MSRKAQRHIYLPVIQTSRLRPKKIAVRNGSKSWLRARGKCFNSSRPSARCGNASAPPSCRMATGGFLSVRGYYPSRPSSRRTDGRQRSDGKAARPSAIPKGCPDFDHCPPRCRIRHPLRGRPAVHPDGCSSSRFNSSSMPCTACTGRALASGPTSPDPCER
jgi:hypothetical protein